MRRDLVGLVGKAKLRRFAGYRKGIGWRCVGSFVELVGKAKLRRSAGSREGVGWKARRRKERVLREERSLDCVFTSSLRLRQQQRFWSRSKLRRDTVRVAFLGVVALSWGLWMPSPRKVSVWRLACAFAMLK